MDATNGDKVQGAEAKTPGGPTSDTPFNAAELAKRRMAFVSHPVTPAAHVWLKENDLAFNQRLRGMLIRRAENEGQQLTLEATQSVWNALLTIQEKEDVEREALYEPATDDQAIKVLGNSITCRFPVPKNGKEEYCGASFQPSTWNKVWKDGSIATFKKGPVEGETIRKGNFGIVDGQPVPLCRNHGRAVEQGGGYLYPYAEAVRRCEMEKHRQDAVGRFQGRRR